jgi:Transposase DDE domain
MSRRRNGRGGRARRDGRSKRGPGASAAASYPYPLRGAMCEFLLPALGLPAAAAAAGGSRRPRRRRDRRTRWTPLTLAVSAVLVAWETARSLGERFERACATTAALFPELTPLGGTYQGWVKALGRGGGGDDDKALHARVAAGLRACSRRVAGVAGVAGGAGHWVRDGWCAFVVDGTRIDCPRTAANRRALRRAGRKGTGPQLYLTVIYHVGTGLPWAWEVGRSTASEHAHLRRMLKLLPAGALLIADAGLVGYDLLRTIRRRGLHFLIRVGSNVSLLTELGCVRREGDQTVYLWPGNRRSRSPLALRLIRVARPVRHGKTAKAKAKAKAKAVWLLTDLKAGELSDAAAGRFYALRWGVEVFFRSFKQNLGRRRMCGRTPARARVELHWSVVALWLAQLVSVKAVVDAGHDPLSWSMAAALRVLRAAAAAAAAAGAAGAGEPGGGGGGGGGDVGPTPGARRTQLARRLAGCRKDAYRRTRPKSSRHWPHKKRDRPPGDPKLRIATVAEVRKATEVYVETAAA